MVSSPIGRTESSSVHDIDEAEGRNHFPRCPHMFQLYKGRKPRRGESNGYSDVASVTRRHPNGINKEIFYRVPLLSYSPRLPRHFRDPLQQGVRPHLLPGMAGKFSLMPRLMVCFMGRHPGWLDYLQAESGALSVEGLPQEEEGEAESHP